MPGNFGGIGQLFGSLRGGMGGMGGMRGMGGMGNMAGGMGGGMNGMGSMGGMGAAQSRDASQTEVSAAEEYDVDRWKRADEQEQWNRQNGIGERSALEQVRQEWESKNKKKTSRLQSRLQRLMRKDGKSKEQETLPAGYTEHGMINVRSSPGRRSEEERRLQKISESAAEAAEAAGREAPAPAGTREEPDAGREENVPYTREFRRFFTENPINSVLLAYDCLSTGPLTLNQVVQNAGGTAQTGWSHDSTTGYMDNLRESGQRRKYEVHIVE